MAPIDIRKHLKNVHHESLMSVQQLQKSAGKFYDELTNIFDEEQPGRPKDVSTLQFCKLVEAKKIMENCNIWLSFTAIEFNISFGTVQCFVIDPMFSCAKNRLPHIVLPWRHLVMHSMCFMCSTEPICLELWK